VQRCFAAAIAQLFYLADNALLNKLSSDFCRQRCLEICHRHRCENLKPNIVAINLRPFEMPAGGGDPPSLFVTLLVICYSAHRKNHVTDYCSWVRRLIAW
jgi:hypothetical protein